MIILEGPDGSGKSLLIAELRQRLHVPIHDRHAHSTGGPVPDLFRWAWRDVSGWLLQSTKINLYDRHPMISEYVYGPATRGMVARGFHSPEAGTLRKIMEQQALVILCLPPLEAVRTNVASEGVRQMDGVVDNIDRIYSGYEAFKSTWGGQLVSYDYTRRASANHNPMPGLIRRCVLHMKERGR